MKKWDNDNRLRTYATKILNAKPTIQYNSVKQANLQVTRETDFSSHASCRSDKSQNIKDSILYKQLQEYNLQQHTNQLHLRGYQQGLQVLAYQSAEYQNQILEELKLPAGHKQKFVDLFKYLQEHPNAMASNAVFTPTTFQPKKSVQAVAIGKFTNPKELQTEILRPPVVKKPSQQRFSPIREGSISKTKQLLPKIEQSKSIPRKNSENRQKSKEKSHQSIGSQQFQINNNSRQYTGHSNQAIREKEKKKCAQSKKAQDDIILVTEYHKDKPQTKIKENRLLKNLEKVQNNQVCPTVDLHLEQIKLMYQSFEGGHLCSTLINIDIEEICNCLASALQKYLKIEQIKINPIQEDILEIGKQNQTIQESPFEQSKINQSQYDEQEFDDDEEEILEKEESTQRDQILQQTQSQFSIESFQGTNDLNEFQKVFTDSSLPNVKPTVEVIQNYCKNIMATTKMEREIAILAMVYIEKLQIEQGIELTCLNWQKILFTALVIASKIWDDESFENNNFAKVLPQFSTLQINEMEKLFLKLIDYNLYIKQGDYAKQYLMLRAFADKKKRSFPLKQLDLKTIMTLQKKTEQIILKSQFNGGLNKSF